MTLEFGSNSLPYSRLNLDFKVEFSKLPLPEVSYHSGSLLNNSLKQNRGLNTRYIKDLLNFESLIYLRCLKTGLQNIIYVSFNFYSR